MRPGDADYQGRAGEKWQNAARQKLCKQSMLSSCSVGTANNRHGHGTTDGPSLSWARGLALGELPAQEFTHVF